MEVETKYYLGDLVWLISNNKSVKKRVTAYNITVRDDNGAEEIKITYDLDYESSELDENKLFKSKEELLKSL